MRVVSDTSPVCYLVQIGHIHLLPELFEGVMIPTAVAAELSHPGSGQAVQAWIEEPPSWLQILSVRQLPSPWPDLERLHAGEREAISLAIYLGADRVLLDEKKARNLAQSKGLAVSGLLGVLDLAAERGLIPIHHAVEALRRTTFRIEPRLLKLLLDKHS